MASVEAIGTRSEPRYTSEDLVSSKRQKVFDDLGEALVTNDMSAAQEAVATLVKLSPGAAKSLIAQSKNGGSAQLNSGSEVLGALSDAVQSGDTKGAKAIFQEILQNRKSPMVSGSNTTQVLGIGVESVGASNTAPSAGTYLNTLA